MHPSLPIGQNENTPLHLAAAAHAVDLVRIFIDHGGSPNTTNYSNQTCLHASCGGIEKENKGWSWNIYRPFFFAYIECLMLYLSVILCLLSSAFGLGSIVKEAMGLWDKVSKTPVNEPCNDIERLKCLDFLLKWRGIEIDGDCEKPLVNAGLILLKICFQCITNV
jgi:ankyrin repeat protein